MSAKKIANSRLLNSDLLFFKILARIIMFVSGSRLGKTKTIIHGLFWHTTIRSCSKTNIVRIGNGSIIKKTKFYIRGSNCQIIIGENVVLDRVSITLLDNNSFIIIGKNTEIGHGTSLCSGEGKTIEIGDECLFSYNNELRNTDSHSIYDGEKTRVNPGRNIKIGNNVWVGQNCLFLKGAEIPDGCVVGARALVNKSFSEKNSLLVGMPAKMVKKNIFWDKNR